MAVANKAEVFSEFTEKYRGCFDAIEYAIYHTERETANYEAFRGGLWGDFGRMGEECLSLAEWDLHGAIRL